MLHFSINHQAHATYLDHGEVHTSVPGHCPTPTSISLRAARCGSPCPLPRPDPRAPCKCSESS